MASLITVVGSPVDPRMAAVIVFGLLRVDILVTVVVSGRSGSQSLSLAKGSLSFEALTRAYCRL